MDDCGGEIVAITNEKQFASPGYPTRYSLFYPFSVRHSMSVADQGFHRPGANPGFLDGGGGQTQEGGDSLIFLSIIPENCMKM